MFLKLRIVARTFHRGLLRADIVQRINSVGPLKTRTRSISTTPSLRFADEVPFDPILDILYEDFVLNNDKAKKNSKMLTKDPPITSTDLDGMPIVPIDINPWLDEDELEHLIGDSQRMRNKVIGSAAQEEEEDQWLPRKDIIGKAEVLENEEQMKEDNALGLETRSNSKAQEPVGILEKESKKE